MRCAVLFDGAGLSRLGLEQAGHTCTGYELDPWKHWLSKHVGSGNCILADVRDVDLSAYDAVWASPPCQWRSSARTQGDPVSGYATDLLEWSLALPHPILWVENVMVQGKTGNEWGKKWNAAQFLQHPLQNRNRIIGGRYPDPHVWYPYCKWFHGVCPTITATEYKGCATDRRRASRFYGRKLTVDECAHHQGFSIPQAWREPPPEFPHSRYQWMRNIYEGLGNGVPVYLAKAFGEAVKGL
jgi:site-specific DNA-cytosine methylase